MNATSPVPTTCDPQAKVIADRPLQACRAECTCGWVGSTGSWAAAKQQADAHRTIPCQGLTAKGAACKRRSAPHKAYCSHHGSDMDRGATLALPNGVELTIAVTLNGQWFIECEDDEHTVSGDVTHDEVRHFIEDLKEQR